MSKKFIYSFIGIGLLAACNESRQSETDLHDGSDSRDQSEVVSPDSDTANTWDSMKWDEGTWR